jgi:cysteine-rich repeat protein
MNAYANVDHAYISVDYCSGLESCGNGVTDAGESCDDGNLLSGDGCDEFCSRENLLCSEWGECLEGRQTQICYFGNQIRTNVRRCAGSFYFENFLIIVLIFLLIVLILLFLFFPLVFSALSRDKKKK